MASYDGSIRINTKVDSSGMNTGVRQINSSLSGLSSGLRKIAGLVAVAFSVKQLIQFGKESVELASDLAEVQNVVDTAFGSMAYKMEEFAKTSVETFGMSKLTAKQMGSTLMAMSVGMGQAMDVASDKAVEMTGRLGDIASFYNKSMSEVETIGRAVYSGETEPLKQIGVIMTQDTLKAYALAKGYQKTYDQMSANEKLLIRQEYFLERTALASGDFIKTQDSWANQTRILSERWKEFKSVVGSGLISLLTPVIKVLNQMISSMIAFANTINQVMSDVFGIETQQISATADAVSDTAESYEDASDAVEDYADSTEKATKKAQKGISALDDFNNIMADSSSGSGSSGGGGTGGSTAFSGAVESQTVQATEGLPDKIKKAFENADFTDFGRTVGTKIKDALDNIPWADIKEGCNKVAKGIATFLNGYVESGIIQSTGVAMAEGFNTVMGTADTFLTTVNWKNLGSATSESIQKAFNTIDWKLVGKTIIDSLVAGIDLIAGFIDGVDWKSLPKDIATAIMNVCKGANWKSLFSSLGNLGGVIVKAMIDLNQGISDALGDVAETIKNYFVDKIKQAGWDKDNSLAENGVALIKGIFRGITDFCMSINSWIYENILVPFVNSFMSSVNTDMGLTDSGKKLVEKVMSGITSWMSGIQAWVKTNITDKINNALKVAQNALSTLTLTAKTKVGEFKSKAVTSFNKASEWIRSQALKLGIKLPTWAELKQSLKSMINNIINFLNNNLIKNLNRMLTITVPDNALTRAIGLDNATYSIFNIPNIPRLAKGGITTGSTLANIGEAGREVVLPLENNTAWMDDLADKLASKMNNSVTFQVEGDPNGIFRVTQKQANEYFNRTGNNAFAF